MKLKELYKEMQLAQMRKFEGEEILGFKLRIYTRSSQGYKYKALYAYKCVNGKKTQIFLGCPESVEEIEEKIKGYLKLKSDDILENKEEKE